MEQLHQKAVSADFAFFVVVFVVVSFSAIHLVLNVSCMTLLVVHIHFLRLKTPRHTLVANATEQALSKIREK